MIFHDPAQGCQASLTLYARVAHPAFVRRGVRMLEVQVDVEIQQTKAIQRDSV